jgi:hypothetical protein
LVGGSNGSKEGNRSWYQPRAHPYDDGYDATHQVSCDESARCAYATYLDTLTMASSGRAGYQRELGTPGVAQVSLDGIFRRAMFSAVGSADNDQKAEELN